MTTPVVPVPWEVLVPRHCPVAVEGSSQHPGKEHGPEAPRDFFLGTYFTRVQDGGMDYGFHTAAGSPGVS